MKNLVSKYNHSEFLQEGDLLPATDCCPWCESADLRLVRPLQKSPDVMLRQCEECAAATVSRMPTDRALDRFYGNYYQREHVQKSGMKVTHDDPRRMARHLAGFARRHHHSAGFSLLDFGGGDGSLGMLTANELLKSGRIEKAEVTVVDYCNECCTPLDDRISMRSCPELPELRGASFDYVIASGVVEHIPDAPRILPEVLSLVAPGGIFYARTPQVLSFMRLSNTLPINWDFYFPAHVYDLGQIFWEDYFRSENRKADFAIIRSRPSIVETSFRVSPVTALFSYLFKAPWYLLRRSWGFVGGWEIVVERR